VKACNNVSDVNFLRQDALSSVSSHHSVSTKQQLTCCS